LPAASNSHKTDPIESRSAVASTRDGAIELGIDGNIAVAGFSITTAPPASLDVPGSGRSVGPAAGEDHRDEPGTEDVGCALEQDVDGGRDRAGHGRVEPQVALADLHEPVGGNDENHAVLQRLALLDHTHRQRCVAGEDLVQMTGPARVEMLGDDDRRRKVGRQARNDTRERLDAPSRRADHDELGLPGDRLTRHDVHALSPALDP
jgi:hypothetical protein